MSDYFAGTMTVRNREFELVVDSFGQWIATLDGTEISDMTREGLEKKLQRMTARAAVKVEVPFTYIDDGVVKDGVATGLHASSGKVLARVGGRAMQISSYGRGSESGHGTFKPMNDAAKNRFRVLNTAVEQARADLAAFCQPLGLNLGDAVNREIQAALIRADEAGAS